MAGGFLALVAMVGFGLVIWLVRPRPPVHPLYLIGSDVDGLVLVEVSRSSSRVAGFLETLIRPISYEVQSRPEDLEQDISQLLDVVTFREAIGLFHYDPRGRREQWAWVIELKRMGAPLKVVVKELCAREATKGMETETSGGVLLFRARSGTPWFAIASEAAVVAGDREWLSEILSRLERPLPRTPRANRLYYGLPAGGKHVIARACLLVPPQRWEGWAKLRATDPPPLDTIARLRQVFQKTDLEPSQIESLAVTAKVQPRRQLKLDLKVLCNETTASVLLARHLREQWPDVVNLLLSDRVANVTEPTTAGASVSLSWTTPRLEQMLGLRPDE